MQPPNIDGKFSFSAQLPPPKFTFMDSDGAPVGVLEVIDHELRFSGNADEAAAIFFTSCLKGLVDSYLKSIPVGHNA